MVTSIRRWSLQCLIAGLMIPALPLAADDSEAVVRLGGSKNEGVVRISDAPKTIIRAQSPDTRIEPLPSIPSLIQPVEFREQPIDAIDIAASPIELMNCEKDEFPSAAASVAATNCPPCPPGQGIVSSEEYYQGAGHGSYGGYDANCRVPLHLRIVSGVRNKLAYDMAWVRGKTGLGDRRHGEYGNCPHGRNCPYGDRCRGNRERNRTKLGENPLAGKYQIVYPVDPGYFDARDGQVYAAQGYGGPVSVPLAPVVNHSYNYGWGIPSSRLTPVLHPVTQTPISQSPSPIPSAPISY